MADWQQRGWSDCLGHDRQQESDSASAAQPQEQRQPLPPPGTDLSWQDRLPPGGSGVGGDRGGGDGHYLYHSASLRPTAPPAGEAHRLPLHHQEQQQLPHQQHDRPPRGEGPPFPPPSPGIRHTNAVANLHPHLYTQMESFEAVRHGSPQQQAPPNAAEQPRYVSVAGYLPPHQQQRLPGLLGDDPQQAAAMRQYHAQYPTTQHQQVPAQTQNRPLYHMESVQRWEPYQHPIAAHPSQAHLGDPIDRRTVPARHSAAQAAYSQHPHRHSTPHHHQQYYHVQAYQVVPPPQRQSLPYSSMPGILPDRRYHIPPRQPPLIARSQSQRLSPAPQHSYQPLSEDHRRSAYAQQPQLYVPSPFFGSPEQQMYGLPPQRPRQHPQVQPGLMISPQTANGYLQSLRTPAFHSPRLANQTGPNCYAAGLAQTDGSGGFLWDRDPYAAKYGPIGPASPFVIPYRVADGPTVAAQQYRNLNRTTTMSSTNSSSTSAGSSHPIRLPRRVPVVYPAMLSRVAIAFEERISLSTHYKDSLEYRGCFDGREAVDKLAFIIKTTDRNLALLLGRALDAQKLFHDVTWDHRLRDSVNELYMFTNLPALHARIAANHAAARKGLPPPPASPDQPEGSLPNGIFTLLTDCYSPTCTRDQLCYSIACPRRLEQQTRLNMVPKGAEQPDSPLKRSLSRASLSESKEEQKLWIDTVSKEVAASTAAEEKKRQEVLFELIYTEKDFLRDLGILERLYIWPLRTTSVIPESRRKDILAKLFQNVEGLKPITEAFCNDLQVRQKAAPVIDHIGDIFLKHLEDFGAFVRYGANQVYSKVALEQESAVNPEFAKFVQAQERLADSRKLPIQSFLGRPTTRLGRYKLLLEAVLTYTEVGNQDQADIPKALEKVKSLLSQINVETGINDNRLRLSQINDRLIRKTEEYRDLKLLDPDRVLIRDGVLRKKAGVDTIELTAFLLDNYLLLAKKKKGKDGQLEYKVHKSPIPLEMIALTEDLGTARPGVRRRSSVFFGTGGGNGGTGGKNTASGDADIPPNLSGVGGGGGGRLARHHRSSSADLSNAGAKQGYPFTLTQLGKSGGVHTLYATTAAERRQWTEKIEKQVELLLKRKKVFSMKIICHNGFTHANRVLCASVFDVAGGNKRLVVGTDDGLYVNSLDQPELFRRVIELERVSQVEVLEDYSIVFALSRGELLSFDIEALEAQESVASKRPRRISSHVTFFRVGECLGRKLMCAVKSTSLSSTVKVLEPVAAPPIKKKAGFGKLLMRGANETLKLYKEFYIPTESSSINFLRSKLCVGCTKGFEIVDLESLKTQGLLDPADEKLKFANRENVVPIAIFRINDNEFLLCYDLFAFYVDKSGHRAKADWFIVWEGKPEAFAILDGHLLAFEPSFIEVRNMSTGQLVQVIRTRSLRFLAATRTEVVCITSGATPGSNQIIYCVVPLTGDDEEEAALALDVPHCSMSASDSLSTTVAETPFTGDYGKADGDPSNDYSPDETPTAESEDASPVASPDQIRRTCVNDEMFAPPSPPPSPP